LLACPYFAAVNFLKIIFMEHIEHINRIELQGHVGTVRYNEYNGSKVINFSLATELLYKTREGASSETTWHNVVAWEGRDMPDLGKITKGTPVNVKGRLRTSRYTSADGSEKLFYEVLAGKISILNDESSRQD
jgi:single-strand DNA-binding protein